MKTRENVAKACLIVSKAEISKPSTNASSPPAAERRSLQPPSCPCLHRCSIAPAPWCGAWAQGTTYPRPAIAKDERVPTKSIEEVLPAICEHHRARITGILAQYRIPFQDGEDLVQNALLAAVTRWPEIRDPEAWLTGTLRNGCLLYWRRHYLHQEFFDPTDLTEIEVEATASLDRRQKDLLIDLDRLLFYLSPDYRRLIVLRFRRGLSAEETARALGLAEASIPKTTLRALARLQSLVDARSQTL